MGQIVAAYQVGSFTVPTNGTPADADQVRGNDNALRAAFNAHDAEAGIHLQGGLLANRPIAGVATRKYLTTDTRRLYYDDGVNWVEAGYLPVLGGAYAGSISIQATGTVSFSTGGFTRWLIDDVTGALYPAGGYDLGKAGIPVTNIYFTALKNAAGTQLLSSTRDTGWSAMTGTTNKATVYDTATVTLAQLAGRVMALQAALTGHGLIGA